MPAPAPRWLVPALALAVSVLLVAAVAGAVVVDDESEPDAVAAATTTSGVGASSTAPATSTTTPSTVQALVDELEAFVAKERGLAFTAPVKVTLLDDAAFRRRLLDDEERDQQEVEEATRVLAALHLIDPEIDLGTTLDDLFGGATAGFYDSKTKELVVRGARPTPYVKEILAHELTHALQDQHFGIYRPALDDADDETGQAFSGLLEGDAVRIQRRYRRSLPRAQQREAAREEASLGGDGYGDIPDVLVNLLTFPYATGPDLVAALLRNGGQARLDAAFANPPTTSEHLLHPETFIAGQQAVQVAPPPAGGKVIDKGVFGELGLLLIFTEEHVDGSFEAANGWGGDWYVAWDEGERTCVRASFVMDTPADAGQLRVALREWAGHFDGVTVEGDSPTTLTSCA